MAQEWTLTPDRGHPPRRYTDASERSERSVRHNGLEMSRPASAWIVSQTRFAGAGRVGSIELLGSIVHSRITTLDPQDTGKSGIDTYGQPNPDRVREVIEGVIHIGHYPETVRELEALDYKQR